MLDSDVKNMMTKNLNELTLANDDGSHTSRIDHSIRGAHRDVCVFFDRLEDEMVRLIDGSSVVVGCMAWLTNPRILRSMQGRDCAIVVQKEDLWRPDGTTMLKSRVAKLYRALDCSVNRSDMVGTELADVSTNGDTTMHPVRCLGNHSSSKAQSIPRMHNKFLLFGRYRDAASRGEIPWEFEAVWTGSFNASWTATQSLENAVVIRSPEVVAAYLREWVRIYALSEPLDWSSEWAEPEWRIGT